MFILPYSLQDADGIRFVLNGGRLEGRKPPATTRDSATKDGAPGPVTWGLLALGLAVGLTAAAVARSARRKPKR